MWLDEASLIPNKHRHKRLREGIPSSGTASPVSARPDPIRFNGPGRVGPGRLVTAVRNRTAHSTYASRRLRTRHAGEGAGSAARTDRRYGSKRHRGPCGPREVPPMGGRNVSYEFLGETRPVQKTGAYWAMTCRPLVGLRASPNQELKKKRRENWSLKLYKK